MPQDRFQTTNPANERTIREYEFFTEEELDLKLREARHAFVAWKRRSVAERTRLLRELGSQLLKNKPESSKLVTDEMGKPHQQAEAEIKKCARLCDYYAEHGPRFLEPVHVTGNDARRCYVRFDPLGAVLAVMPWNFPYWQVFRFAVPTLLAGNVGLLKHARNVTGCAQDIERLFRESGFPPGVLSTLLIPTEQVSQLIADPLVRAVTLTGSEAAGRSVAETAGKHLKKSVLELGGSDPFIVLADADLDHAVDQGVQSRTQNTGQSCIAAKRFILEASIYDEFTGRFTEKMQSLSVGDPHDGQTDLGPLAREDLIEDLDRQVQRSVSAGAKLLTGGKRLDRKGYFYAPTVLADVEADMPAFQEETFGPVAAMIRATDAEDAVELANHSTFGLGANIFTSDIGRAEQLAVRVDSGCLSINAFVKSDPSAPFGGVKNSGYGRELGAFGIREFVNVKTVWVA